MRPQDGTVEKEIARIASGGHGVVARSQLLAAGLTADRIRRRVRSGALIPVHRGVYRVGHRAPSFEADCLAAVLAAGPGAVLGGLAAARLLGLLREAPDELEVTAPRHRRIPGVRVRRARGAAPTESTT